ncbi:EAL domain-containing protein [Actinoplanes sp. NBC_00393]|uniref:putative bifunctional diguanylate cyclase/phosphodiesterase n=1 Tax=Actinoplanes sp. NBC_00393 TaxID=2975953 RepID=UPI002E248DBA
MAVNRFGGLAAVASGRLGDARFVLACLSGVFAMVCWLALMPGWLVTEPALVAAAVVASVAAVILALIPGIRQGVAHGVAGSMSLLAGCLTVVGRGGVDSAAFAFLPVFVTAYAAMFFNRPAFIAHLAWSLLISGAALTVTDPGNRENGFFVTVLAVAMTTSSVLLARLVRQVWYAATHDPLTGLLNEQGLRAALAADPSGAGTLVMCDINRFAHVNAALGRDQGDELLREVAGALQQVWPRAPLARIAGDVFAVWLAQPASAELPDIILRRLAGRHGPYRLGGAQVDVTFTAGIAAADGSAPPLLLRRAATALAAAKRDGRPFQLWSPALDDARSEDLNLQAELRAGLDNGELVVFFQPQVARHTHHIIGVEALVRWRHPRRGLLSPAAFMPAAEHSPIISDITDHVMQEAIRQGSVWSSAGVPLTVSVNVSARCLTDDALPDRIAQHLLRWDLPAQLLTVEITETAVVAQPQQASRLLHAVRDCGARVSIDDFGTGHTSLALLAGLPVDELKLDRQFIAALAQPKVAAIVATVANLAARLGIDSVAEGVEDEHASRLLDELGFTVQQGYWHARPQPAEAITAMLYARQGSAQPR